jgi:glycosyltransferase involved in cell wall biosynthesis
VALVHLGRPQARGEVRRVAGWQTLLRAAGADVVELAILPRFDRRIPTVEDLRHVGAGRLTPEALRWRSAPVVEELRQLRPDVLICVSQRTWHPRLRYTAPLVILDHVDQLSRSYRQRGRLTRGPAGVGYRVLGSAMERLERSPPFVSARVAAGWSDASALRATWVPIPVAVPPAATETEEADVDLLFFGSLSYPPNVDATRRLERMWPKVRAERPGTSLLVAGAAPSKEVVERAERLGWRLERDFDDVVRLCRRARVAVAPLTHTAGIQIKVLEAAATGLAQVVTPAALAGLAPGFPAELGTTDDELVHAMVQLLEAPRRRTELAAAARDHVSEKYSDEAWRPTVADLLSAAPPTPS